ncbi:MAG: HAMP domain-containing histidine kinase [Spirochaetaceae bacterium]
MDRDHKRFWISILRGRISFFLLIFTVLFSITLLTSISQIVLFNLNINRSVENWKIDRVDRIKVEAKNYLLSGNITDFNEPLEIIDVEYNTIYSNVDINTHPGWNLRKSRKGNIGLIELYDQKLLIGYIRIENMQFKNKTENLNLLNSLITNILYSTMGSIILSFVISLIVSRALSKSTIDINRALKDIEAGQELNFRAHGAKEIREIGISVIKLSKKLNKEKDLRNQWLHDISHDLKTPLSALKLQFEGMLDGYLSLDIERIKKNNREVTRLEHLIMGIDELMKVESPGLILNNSTFPTKELIYSLDERFKDIANAKKRNLNFQNNTKMLTADFELMFKAISNLIENAINYSHEESTITIEFSEIENTNYRVKIENIGKTIPGEDIPYLFDRLYRGDFSRESSGTGLGLSIVDVIIKKHGGYTEVESENGINCFSINWKL